MKNLLRFTAVIFVFLTFLSTTAAAKVPEGWLNGGANFEKAMQLHRELNVPLVIYFYVDWCPYCNELESEYFPTAPMREFFRGVVKIRINPEQTRADEDVARVFGIRGYPGFFVLAPGSFPVQLSPFRRDGRSLTAVEFAQRCRDVITPRSQNGTAVTEAPKAPEPAVKKAPGLQMTVVEAAEPKFVTNAPLPTANAVLAKYMQATSATARMTSRVIKGRVDVPGLSSGGKFEFYATSGGKSLTVINVESVGVLKHGFDGQSTWTSSEHGAKGAEGPGLPQEAVIALADFYRPAKLSELYPKTKLLGKVKEGDRDIYLIDASPRTGTPEKLYFDVQSGLIVHRDYTRSSARGPIQGEIYFSNWRNVDGFRLPWTLTQMIGNLTLVITIDDVQHNVALDESLFTRPAR